MIKILDEDRSIYMNEKYLDFLFKAELDSYQDVGVACAFKHPKTREIIYVEFIAPNYPQYTIVFGVSEERLLEIIQELHENNWIVDIRNNDLKKKVDEMGLLKDDEDEY